MKFNLSRLYQNITISSLTLLTLNACGTNATGLSGTGADSDENPVIIQQAENMTLSAIGTENSACKVLGIDSDAVGIMDPSGLIGFNIELSANYDVTGTGEDNDPFEANADTDLFTLYDADGTPLDSTFSLSPEMDYIDQDEDSDNAGGFEATARANLFVSGLENPDSDTDYSILIPAGSISCEDVELITADYEIAFTLLATTTDSSVE